MEATETMQSEQLCEVALGEQSLVSAPARRARERLRRSTERPVPGRQAQARRAATVAWPQSAP